jgi:sigma-B regulation protein RsbU (phosphoserine phosphatase)
MDSIRPLVAKPRRIGWRRSLRTRLVLWSSLASALLMALVGIVFHLGTRDLLIDAARTDVDGMARQTARGLEATLDSVQVSGRLLADGAAGIGRDPLDLRNLLRATVSADQDIVGAMLIIEPGRLSADDPGFSWSVRRDGSELRESSVTELGVDYRVEPWYIRTITGAEPWWSEPYANATVGGVSTTTYYLPLRPIDVDGAPGPAIGLVSLDVPMSRLSALLADVPRDVRLRAALLTPERRFIGASASPTREDARLDALVDGGARPDLAPLRQALQADRPIAFEHVGPRVAGAAEQRLYTVAQPVNDTGWAFVLSASDDYVLQALNRMTLWVLAVGLIGSLVAMLLIRRSSSLVATPIEDLTESARQLARGDFDHPMPHSEREDEVGVMARAFDVARGSIKAQMREIAAMGDTHARLESELRIASDIQQALLPRPSEFGAGGVHLGLHGMLVPAKTVGGDFYNFFERDGDALWFVIGDVSDKGVPAAVFMARTMTVLEVAAQAGGSPGHALREAARHLIDGNDTCMFATVLCGVIELRTGVVSLASAGHEPPVLLRADGTRTLVGVPTTPPLGVEVADMYPAWRGRLRPGDALFTYTDGITESFDADNQAYGIDRLLDALDPARDPKQQCDALVADVQAFAGGAPQSDDITVLAIRFERVQPAIEPFSVRAVLAPPLPEDPIRALIASVDAGLSRHGLPKTLIHDVHLVIEEIASNVLSHGNSGHLPPSLELIATVDGTALEMEFTDDGLAFNPMAQPAPDLDADIGDRPIGGLGVHLVRQLAERIDYSRTRGRNILKVTLPIPHPETRT